MFEKIIVKLHTTEPDIKLISLLRGITGLGVTEIKNRIINNKAIAEFILFNNDHLAVEESLIELIKQASASKNRLLLYDIRENENSDDLEDLSKNEITIQMLLNYFNERKSDIEKYYEKPNE